MTLVFRAKEQRVFRIQTNLSRHFTSCSETWEMYTRCWVWGYRAFLLVCFQLSSSCFTDKMLLCIPGWPQACDAPASASHVLRVQMCATQYSSEDSMGGLEALWMVENIAVGQWNWTLNGVLTFSSLWLGYFISWDCFFPLQNGMFSTYL